MTNEEKYYRRAYSLIDRLGEVYQKGFDRKKILQFWKEELMKFNNNPYISSNQHKSVMLTIVIALLGINKESIEKSEKITDYNESIVHEDFRKLKLMEDSLQKINSFENNRIVNSLFDNWLSIQVSPSTDSNNKDIFRRVRNGLLHSNFYVDLEAFQTSYTHIKTKSYYESIIFNENFYQFIMSYFGNVSGVGLTDKDIVYDFKQININNRNSFKKFLEETTIIEIENNLKKYDGTNSLGIKLQESLSKNKQILSPNRLTKILNKVDDNGINIKDIKEHKLSEIIIDNIIESILKKYNNFYQLNQQIKTNIIVGELRYRLNNKGEISNWLMHFYGIVNSLSDKNFNIENEWFSYDEFANSSCYATLIILKAYLILYRLQNNSFDKLEYDKINFDFNDDRYYLWSENKDGNQTEDYYEETYNKLKNKNQDMTNEQIKKLMISEVIRDGLAHGNIKTFTDSVDNIVIIEIKDIHPKTKNARCIQMTLDKFKDFLNSEAFIPKNCYKKEEKSRRFT